MSSPAPAPRPVLTPQQAKRANQPWTAMVLSVLATLALVLVVIALNPEPAPRAPVDRVDVAAAAATVPRQDDDVAPALAPEVPEPWYANYARLQPVDGLTTWDVGWVASDTVFVGLQQAWDADPTWVNLRVGAGERTPVDVDGVTWEHVDRQNAPEQHLVTVLGGSTVVLTTTGDRAALEELARAVVKETR